MKRGREFAPSVGSVREARRFVTEVLNDCSTSVRDRVALMVSELATNAVKHARTGFKVEIDVSDTVRVEVRDVGGGRPEVQHPTGEEASGRGLQIVEALAEKWGTHVTPEACTVWFVVCLG